MQTIFKRLLFFPQYFSIAVVVGIPFMHTQQRGLQVISTHAQRLIVRQRSVCIRSFDSQH